MGAYVFGGVSPEHRALPYSRRAGSRVTVSRIGSITTVRAAASCGTPHPLAAWGREKERHEPASSQLLRPRSSMFMGGPPRP